MAPLLSGIFSVDDGRLCEYMKSLYLTENIIIEPSSCAAFAGYEGMCRMEEAAGYFRHYAGDGKSPVHIIWATGGSLMPEEIVKEYLN